MRKRPINIIGGFYKDPNLHWSRQDTLNWIPVAAEREGTLTPFQLRDAPGVKPFVRITRTVETEEGDVVIDVGPIRGMRNVEGKLFVVAAQTVYQISNTGVAIPVGTIPGVGRVSMAHNQYGLSNQLIIVNGSAGYIVDTNMLTVTKITDEGYPGAFVADYIDQYLAQVEPQGRFWFHSDLAQGLHYNTLDRYEAEADPDRIVSLIVSHREVLIFGRDTIEPFVNTGGQTGTFERASNTVIEVGCSSKFTPRKLDNSVMWLDDKRIVRRLDGYTPVRISTEAVDAAFSECSELEIAQAYGFTWETQGHKVYYITVPGRFTFGYDVLTQQWHRRATWELPYWDVVDAVFWNGVWIVGSGQNGRLYELDQLYKLDRCDPLVRRRVTGKLWDAENELTLNNVELKFNTGGPVSVCVPFPVQPEGPTITGTPPGGSVGIPYAGYTFTTTPGDAPIARTIILTGSLPPGLTWNQNTATISTGTPTQLGLYTFTPRTIDTNGLFDDIESEIIISMTSLALYSTVGVTSESYQLTDGVTWGSWTAETLINEHNQVVATETAWITFGINGHPARKPLVGAFAASTGTTQSGVGGFRNGAVNRNTGTIILTQGLATPATRSTNDGVSFAPCGLTGINSVMHIPDIDRWIGIRGIDMDAYLSDDDGDTESLAFDIPDSSSAVGLCSFGIDALGYIGASSAFPYTRKLWRTDGTSVVEVSLPSGPGTAVFGVGGGYCSGVLRLVCWTETGELFVRDPETEDWTFAEDQPDGIPASVTSNGAMLIMSVNKDNPLDNEGIEQTSTDGNTWTERLRTTIGDTEGFSAVCALLEPL